MCVCVFACVRVVANALHSAQCPFLALIVLRNGRMTIVAKIQGAIGKFKLMHSKHCLEGLISFELNALLCVCVCVCAEPNDLLVRLHRLTTEYGALLEAARLDRYVFTGGAMLVLIDVTQCRCCSTDA